MADNNVTPSSSHTNPTPNSTTNPSFHPFSTVVNIKLDITNYPLWLAQILPILKSRDLMGYVDGTLVSPSKYVSGSTAVDPAYTAWVQQDQMILSWINGSLTASVLFVLASKRTARATWEALEQRAAQACDSPITYPTLEALLLTTERRMAEHTAPLVESAQVNAFVASRGRGFGRPRGTGRGASSSFRGTSFNHRGPAPHNNNNTNFRTLPCSSEQQNSSDQTHSNGVFSSHCQQTKEWNLAARHRCQRSHYS
ncbi:hypothetical protein D8674_023646 [Pyrus ussuriensis x Pyrus communis]|uniref:Retrotransposon Copia-like N-terminal domain-containing protein n=1 Tax=Pyrus ussuriensis x Pyrus communis TaxID=2448454 RepID=A0A5N5HEA3_9ROSA|nr:hypothetical protein D8674_023646 [Pyrus ussuriensis x Pyrus communis]